MKFAIVNIITEDVHCTLNHIKPEDAKKLVINPKFARNIAQAKENEKIRVVDLEMLIVGTEEAPSPFNMKVRTRGIFEVEDMQTEQDNKVFNLSATEILFPYLRSVVATITGSALSRPYTLPAVPTTAIFTEDRETGNFEVPNQPTPEQS